MPIERRHTEGAAADPCPLGAFCFLDARSIMPFIVLRRLVATHLTVWMFQTRSRHRYVRKDWYTLQTIVVIDIMDTQI